MIDPQFFAGAQAALAACAAKHAVEMNAIDQVDVIVCEDGETVMIWAYASEVEMMTYAPDKAPPDFDERGFGDALLAGISAPRRPAPWLVVAQ
jgi:hypothetical protein